MTNFKKTFKVSATADADAEEYTIEFDMALLTSDDIHEYAMRSIVIQAQATKRAWDKSDKEKANPFADGVYKVPKPGTKTADPEKRVAKLEAALKGLTPEQLAEFLKRAKTLV